MWPEFVGGGKGASLGDQGAIGGDAERRVMMEAAPAASLVMPEAEFLFQVLVIALDPPAQLDQIDECSPCDVGRQGREPVFDRLLLAAWPFDQQPFFGARRRRL